MLCRYAVIKNQVINKVYSQTSFLEEKEMDDRKKLIVLQSALSCSLTLASLLFQLCGVFATEMQNRQSYWLNLQQELMVETNLARKRYSSKAKQQHTYIHT